MHRFRLSTISCALVPPALLTLCSIFSPATKSLPTNFSFGFVCPNLAGSPFLPGTRRRVITVISVALEATSKAIFDVLTPTRPAARPARLP